MKDIKKETYEKPELEKLENLYDATKVSDPSDV
jgi:hypothetical protein